MTTPRTTGYRLSGTRVLITGAGSGIGRLMALEAAQRGAEVIIWDRRWHAWWSPPWRPAAGVS